MDATAENFNSNATEDDGSCIYACSNPEYHCLEIEFNHFVDNLEIIYQNDNLIYNNAAGNIYSVRRMLYVLSDVMLFFEDGTNLLLDEFIFINTDDPETLTKTIYDLPGLCAGISFSLGFSSEKNIDNEYLNSPNNFHNAMVWPNLNGTNLAFQGGYHYMKLEGKYDESFYNTHTGPTNAEDFSIAYPVFYFTPSESISINMNVNNWYNEPIYDMNLFGSGIMDNIEAQIILYQNGSDIFSIETQ